MEVNPKELLVRRELEQLLAKYSLTEAISAIDDIVLSYVLGVLECLGCHDDLDETEDVEPFAETMEAYFPGFFAISLPDVGEWMSTTAGKLSKWQESDSHQTSSLPEPDSVRNSSASVGGSASLISSPPTSPALPDSQPQQCQNSSDKDEGACGDRRKVVVQDVDADSMATLRELCPAASTAELQHCLHMSEGKVEEAACLLLFRQESDVSITVKTASRSRKKSSSAESSLQDDESVKDSILAKYSFVDTSEDKTEHRPELFRKEQKKMIRYREGQVVSTKGERFSEIKKQESDDLKKTYVSLKPQRKYRFH